MELGYVGGGPADLATDISIFTERLGHPIDRWAIGQQVSHKRFRGRDLDIDLDTIPAPRPQA